MNEIDKAYVQGATIRREGSAVVDVNLGSDEVWQALMAGYNETTYTVKQRPMVCVICEYDVTKIGDRHFCCDCDGGQRIIGEVSTYPLSWRFK